MADRIEFEMTSEQHERLLDACKPTPAMWGPGGVRLFSTPQENANHAWRALGDEMGFDWTTVQPIPGKGSQFFRAVALTKEEPPC